MTTVGEELVLALRDRGVEVVFGIPGVHTIELYRGLAESGIRHVTPRHEQGAGFMADGYARVCGKPGVCFVITGPGLTNTITPMAQARADSVPMLIVSSVNRLASLGKGLGHLHELPDQHGLAASVAVSARQVLAPAALHDTIDDLWRSTTEARPGPSHLEVPIDLLEALHEAPARAVAAPRPQKSRDGALVEQAARHLGAADRPVILAGGGAKRAEEALRGVAEALDAPVIQTVNARGLMHRHPLIVPASPSLRPVRDLIAGADAVLAVGTELGPTEYDIYATGEMAPMTGLVRIDICPDQLSRVDARISIAADAAAGLDGLIEFLPADRTRLDRGGSERAADARQAAWSGLEPDMRMAVDILETLRQGVPGAIIVGDSAQPVYAGNLYYDHDRPGGWFNAATGYGALGYAIPAAIGAALAAPEEPVICLTGDGGAQFSIAELMTARDEDLPIIFLVWNNHGYLEIEKAMRAAEVSVVGCDPTPPEFAAIARACRIPYQACTATPADLARTLSELRASGDGPVMIEIDAR
ncbi:hypothetical protein DQW77_09555 [Roseovarius sp. TE539]|uniref:5-guanidino-2-oxopentanoate decarboxylase n=1 Tax=Roseovarius sp. TE539 TaxID=2249812 RepID=UPI000DDD9283|nr:5-guanidino-2-oxopentanoate decarboxylase [Roseovarius sp. TE539]RBI73089.1 hypothetical protein DQW77_09555 [Roseovarius sp. TE539]